MPSFVIGWGGLLVPTLIRSVEAANSAADDIADAVLELREDQLFLSAANVLHERLLGILGGNAPEICGRDFDPRLAGAQRISTRSCSNRVYS